MGEYSRLLHGIQARDSATEVDVLADARFHELAQRTGKDNSAGPFVEWASYQSVFQKAARSLCRRSKRHVLFVAERGVGALMVVQELARRAATRDVQSLGGRSFVLVDGRCVRPTYVRRFLEAIAHEHGPRRDVVICIDGFGSIVTAAEMGGDVADIAAVLASVVCRVVGLCTPHECDGLLGGRTNLHELFTRIDVPEPSIALATQLVSQAAHDMEAELAVHIESAAIEGAVQLSAKYVVNERLPGKAIRILGGLADDVCYDMECGVVDHPRVTVDDVIRVVSEETGISEGFLGGKGERIDFQGGLRQFVVSQDEVIREVVAELELIHAGWTDPDKPASVMLLVGQTGTGKTELAKALARLYSRSKKLQTYTMGNFVEPHSVAGIIGVPPGYVGHDFGGRLVNDLNADPYGVFLLDEADKAHPDVLQPFLNLFDEGWVRDQRGVKANGERAMFILTTNVAQRLIGDMVRTGKSMDEIRQEVTAMLPRIRHSKADRPVFSPEFLSRIKRILVFRPLDQEAMEGICRKVLRDSQQTWRAKRDKELRVDDEVIQHIAEIAHKKNEQSLGNEGGRIVRKLFADVIELKVQRAIMENSNRYRACRGVRVSYQAREEPSAISRPDDGSVSIEFLGSGDR